MKTIEIVEKFFKDNEKALSDILLKSGSRYGHNSKKRHPNFTNFILEKNTIKKNGTFTSDIIDITKTLTHLKNACFFICQSVTKRSNLIFVNSKHQTANLTKNEAQRTNFPYITNGWTGGTLTNSSEIFKRVRKISELEKKFLNEKISENITYRKGKSSKLTRYVQNSILPKFEDNIDHANKISLLAEKIEGHNHKENQQLILEYSRLIKKLSGLTSIENNYSEVKVLFIIDPKIDKNALTEAKKTGIKVIALCDSNFDPDIIDYFIPANDDSRKTILLITKIIADVAVLCVSSTSIKDDRTETSSKNEDNKIEIKKTTTSSQLRDSFLTGEYIQTLTNLVETFSYETGQEGIEK